MTAIVFRGIYIAMQFTTKALNKRPKSKIGRIANAIQFGSGFALAFFLAAILEMFYRSLNLIMGSKMRILFWAAILALVIGPAYMLVAYPQYYNVLTAILFNVGLCWASIMVTLQESKRGAESQANQRWLPQAEGACDRLITLKYALKSLQLQTKYRCDEIGDLLPELRDKKNNPLRALLQSQCSDTGHRIGDFTNQLDSAVSDWRRFIREICREGECEVIFDNLDELTTKLDAEFVAAEQSAVGQCMETEQKPDSLNRADAAVTTSVPS